ncbi:MULTISPECIES: CheR family methyltransferase [Hydrogenophaga]|uniref:Chemotaxis protein methyltransferase n=1 Tax=Hydrogenophaga intermedia TaxID=65786 RepID=A0A1L1PQT2_HYDIT|nr:MULTISPECIES: CheR family methyltransferase [Hydrogenophaga]AOS77757.1 chemotaxis protein CheR [Hydrogenophaga sp. PBC]TMU75907.1 methyltransferase domain-containing protein [Hydrogenophaga intermedia]CDN90109.1 Chemotaxis protein methyltransferase [Hydrogenophaga intermedia]
MHPPAALRATPPGGQHLRPGKAGSAVFPGSSSALVATEDGPVAEGREFVWSDADFTRIKALIYKKAGISLHDGKHAMVYSRVSRRLRETGHTSFKGYIDWLEGHDGPEWQEFINALTTNLTAFFRESHHFDALAQLLRAKPAHDWRIWCAAASTGEEPYSIAMTCAESLGTNGRYEIVNSDIDTKVLATAQRGVYKTDGGKGLSPERLQRFFLRGKGANAGQMRVKPELQKHMSFQPVNLIHELPLRDTFDVVFCRNVMIYFDAATQRAVLERIHRVMRPGGTLFVGHAENFSDARHLFALRGKTVYERL